MPGGVRGKREHTRRGEPLQLSHSEPEAVAYTLFFFNDTATTEIYTLSLHDALPISAISSKCDDHRAVQLWASRVSRPFRSEEHTSELQSHSDLVCRLLLEKKKAQRRQAATASTLTPRQPVRRREPASSRPVSADAQI